MKRFGLSVVLVCGLAGAFCRADAPVDPVSAACQEAKIILKTKNLTPTAMTDGAVFETYRGDQYRGCTVTVTDRLINDPLRDAMAKAGWKTIPSYWVSQNKKTSWAIVKGPVTCVLNWSWSKESDPLYVFQCTKDPFKGADQ